VCSEVRHTDSGNGSSLGETIIAALNSRTATLTPGTVVGAGVYLQSGDVRQALLVCLLGPPAMTAAQVLARWVELLAPPRRWRRRPRRRGS
jgi:hypothetical protein